MTVQILSLNYFLGMTNLKHKQTQITVLTLSEIRHIAFVKASPSENYFCILSLLFYLYCFVFNQFIFPPFHTFPFRLIMQPVGFISSTIINYYLTLFAIIRSIMSIRDLMINSWEVFCF